MLKLITTNFLVLLSILLQLDAPLQMDSHFFLEVVNRLFSDVKVYLDHKIQLQKLLLLITGKMTKQAKVVYLEELLSA